MHMHLYKATFLFFGRPIQYMLSNEAIYSTELHFFVGGRVVKNIDSGADLTMSNQEL